MPPLVPVQQTDAAERIALERSLSELATEPERGAQRAFRRIEAFEEGGHVSLSQVRLGQAGGRASGRQERDELFDNLLLPAAQAERLGQPFLVKQQIHDRVRAGVVIGQLRDPAPDALQRRQRVGELRQRSRALGRSTAVVDRFTPRLGVCKVMGEQGRKVGSAIFVIPLEGPSHHLVERAPLPFEQAVVGDLLRQHVPEAIRGLGQDARSAG